VATLPLAPVFDHTGPKRARDSHTLVLTWYCREQHQSLGGRDWLAACIVLTSNIAYMNDIRLAKVTFGACFHIRGDSPKAFHCKRLHEQGFVTQPKLLDLIRVAHPTKPFSQVRVAPLPPAKVYDAAACTTNLRHERDSRRYPQHAS
jgi:hypothetical protein